MRTSLPYSYKKISKSVIKMVPSSGFHIPFTFSQITTATSLAVKGSVHSRVLCVPALTLLWGALLDGILRHSNLVSHSLSSQAVLWNLWKPLGPPALTFYLIVKPGSQGWCQNLLPTWAIVRLVGPELCGFFDGWSMSIMYSLGWSQTVLLSGDNSLPRSTCWVCSLLLASPSILSVRSYFYPEEVAQWESICLVSMSSCENWHLSSF